MADREGTEGTTWNALNSKRVFVSAEAAREGREGKTQPGGIFSRGLRLIKSFANLHTYTHSIRRAARSFATVGFGGRLCRDSYRYLRHPLQSGTLPVINRDLTCFFFFFLYISCRTTPVEDCPALNQLWGRVMDNGSGERERIERFFNQLPCLVVIFGIERIGMEVWKNMEIVIFVIFMILDLVINMTKFGRERKN